MHHTLFEERASIFIGLNAIFQFVGDVVLEGMGLIPPRINHLALTFLNAFISFKSLSAIHKDKFRFLHEDAQVFWLLELLLIIGDVYYSFHDDWGREFILLRLTFVVCSMFNWVFITWIIVKYKLYHITYQGGHDSENESFIHNDENTSDKEHSTSQRDTIEILNMNKQISMDDVDESPKEDTQLKKDASPALEAIDENENMKDYHVDHTVTESVEDSLSNKNNNDNEPHSPFVSKGVSNGTITHNGGYHHTPVPHNDDHSHDVNHNVLSLHPNQHSFTLTHSEVP